MQHYTSKPNICVSHHVCMDSAAQLHLTQQPTEPSEWVLRGCVLDRGHHSDHLYHCGAPDGHTLQRHKWDITIKLNLMEQGLASFMISHYFHISINKMFQLPDFNIRQWSK